MVAAHVARIDPFERDRGQLARYKERREFYEGGQWLERPRRRQAQLTVNYARALVRKVVSYALPDHVGFTAPVPALAERGAADHARTPETARGGGAGVAVRPGTGPPAGGHGAGEPRRDVAGGTAGRAGCGPPRFRAGH